MSNPKVKAILLLSGGLDSQLALRVLQEQGIEVHALTFLPPWYPGAEAGGKLAVEAAAEALGARLTIVRDDAGFLDLLRNPKHGYGKNINPCIDCHAFMVRRAGEFMREVGAAFVATGEVLGERPMSQRRDSMRVVEKESGMEGYVLRPLCAKLLDPTIPEQQGLVDREKLLDLHGRGRKPQMALAKQFGLKDYPGPAGGCYLTDPEFAHRVKDMLDRGAITVNEIHLLKRGRHFRLDDRTKLVIGRNHEDNLAILPLALPTDLLLELRYMPGPVGLLRGDASAPNVHTAAGLVAHYSKARDAASAAVKICPPNESDDAQVVEVAPAAQADADRCILLKVRSPQ